MNGSYYIFAVDVEAEGRMAAIEKLINTVNLNKKKGWKPVMELQISDYIVWRNWFQRESRVTVAQPMIHWGDDEQSK